MEGLYYHSLFVRPTVVRHQAAKTLHRHLVVSPFPEEGQYAGISVVSGPTGYGDATQAKMSHSREEKLT